MLGMTQRLTELPKTLAVVQAGRFYYRKTVPLSVYFKVIL